jgi:hypothetical protein
MRTSTNPAVTRGGSAVTPVVGGCELLEVALSCQPTHGRCTPVVAITLCLGRTLGGTISLRSKCAKLFLKRLQGKPVEEPSSPEVSIVPPERRGQWKACGHKMRW